MTDKYEEQLHFTLNFLGENYPKILRKANEAWQEKKHNEKVRAR